MKLNRLIIGFFCLFQVLVFAQTGERYESEYAQFYRGEELFEKQKYSASQKEFEEFLTTIDDKNDPFYVKAKYYFALNALLLYQPNAEFLLLQFLQEYPETVYRNKIYLELGRYYYRNRRYKDVIVWLTKVDKYNVSEDDKPEFYFKLGYSYFIENQLKEARNSFYEILSIESQYQNPALYYYSHIAYTEKNYQVALEGFLKLQDNPSFKETVPYYIVQIYYLQEKYEKVIEYAPGIVDENSKHNIGMSLIIGDSYYKLAKYDEAVPFLEDYNRRSATTRDEDYQLGFAYYKSRQYIKAIRMFDKVAKGNDKLSQTALYHIGECYLKEDNYMYARNAFELAYKMNFDAEIEEDALYNFAILSYKIDYNPFNEAVIALNLYLEKYPNSKRTEDIYQYLINVYSTMKNYKSAIETIDKIPNKDIRLKSAYQMMAYNYGVELFANSKHKEAIEIFKLVKKYPIEPKYNALSLYWIAESQFYLNDFQASINTYRQFMEEPGSYSLPEHNAAHYNIGYVYFKQSNWEMAIQSFRTFVMDENERNKEKITDAYLRIGDAYYKDKQDEQALAFYQKAIDTQGGQIDYAKFQMGKSLGYLERYKEKASLMLDIVNNHPKSTFLVPALYEVGESYRLMDNEHTADAIKYYNQLVTDYPSHNLVKDAIFQMGVLYFTNKNYNKAEAQFLRILNEFDDEAKKRAALNRLKDVYTALNKPEKYIELVEKYDVKFDEGAKDTLYFENAYHLYEDSLWSESIKAFETYFNTFSNPIQARLAHYFKGTAHLRLKQEQLAFNSYEKFLDYPQNYLTEQAALFSSQFAYDKKDYEKAIKYYNILLKAASFPQNKLIANIGIMRSYAFLKKFSEAKTAALNVLEDENALSYAITEANYVLGKAEMELNNFEKARPYFAHVVKNSNAEIAAESQFNIALIYHLQEDYTQSENEVRNLMKNNASYDYWVAKALILQAKNSIGKADYVQAEYTLNSVLNGYKNTSDGILDEAKKVMEVLQELKNKGKNIPPNNPNVIEINEGGNND